MAVGTPDAVAPRPRLLAEFAALYVGTPLAIALFLPKGWLFPALFLFKGGEAVDQKIGAAPKAALKDWIDAAV